MGLCLPWHGLPHPSSAHYCRRRMLRAWARAAAPEQRAGRAGKGTGRETKGRKRRPTWSETASQRCACAACVVRACVQSYECMHRCFSSQASKAPGTRRCVYAWRTHHLIWRLRSSVDIAAPKAGIASVHSLSAMTPGHGCHFRARDKRRHRHGKVCVAKRTAFWRTRSSAHIPIKEHKAARRTMMPDVPPAQDRTCRHREERPRQAPDRTAIARTVRTLHGGATRQGAGVRSMGAPVVGGPISPRQRQNTAVLAGRRGHAGCRATAFQHCCCVRSVTNIDGHLQSSNRNHARLPVRRC